MDTLVTRDSLVWYAAYGSNLAAERFLTYVMGGPVPGSPTGKVQDGARDTRRPQAWRPFSFAGALYFAEQSRQWGGGGVAFVDLSAPRPSRVLGRAWLLTVEQLADVYRQENGRSVPSRGREGTTDAIDRTAAAVAAAAAAGRSLTSLPASTGWYRQLVAVGELDGRGVVTFTGAEPHAHTRRSAPAAAYRAVIRRGLTETWGGAASDQYLSDAGAPASFEA